MADSLDHLERQAEHQRAILSATIDDIQARVLETKDEMREQFSTGHIKSQMQEYVQRAGRKIESSARENPLQAIGMAAVLAYPAFRVVKSIPLPLMIAGAGVFLVKKSSSSPYMPSGERQRRAIARMQDSAVRTANAVVATSHDLAGAIAEQASDVADRSAAALTAAQHTASDAANVVASRVKQGLSGAGDGATAVVSRVRDGTSAASDGASAAISSLNAGVAQTSDAVNAVISTTANTIASSGTSIPSAKQIGDRLSASGAAVSRNIAAVIADNPLLATGLGLAIGGAIAAFLPRTRVDNRILGGMASGLNHRAKDLAAKGHDAASETVDDFYDRATEEATARGLSVEAIQDTGKDVSEKLSKVAAAAKRTKSQTNGLAQLGEHHD